MQFSFRTLFVVAISSALLSLFCVNSENAPNSTNSTITADALLGNQNSSSWPEPKILNLNLSNITVSSLASEPKKPAANSSIVSSSKKPVKVDTGICKDAAVILFSIVVCKYDKEYDLLSSYLLMKNWTASFFVSNEVLANPEGARWVQKMKENKTEIGFAFQQSPQKLVNSTEEKAWAVLEYSKFSNTTNMTPKMYYYCDQSSRFIVDQALYPRGAKPMKISQNVGANSIFSNVKSKDCFNDKIMSNRTNKYFNGTVLNNKKPMNATLRSESIMMPTLCNMSLSIKSLLADIETENRYKLVSSQKCLGSSINSDKSPSKGKLDQDIKWALALLATKKDNSALLGSEKKNAQMNSSPTLPATAKSRESNSLKNETVSAKNTTDSVGKSKDEPKKNESIMALNQKEQSNMKNGTKDDAAKSVNPLNLTLAAKNVSLLEKKVNETAFTAAKNISLLESIMNKTAVSAASNNSSSNSSIIQAAALSTKPLHRRGLTGAAGNKQNSKNSVKSKQPTRTNQKGSQVIKNTKDKKLNKRALTPSKYAAKKRFYAEKISAASQEGSSNTEKEDTPQ